MAKVDGSVNAGIVLAVYVYVEGGVVSAGRQVGVKWVR